MSLIVSLMLFFGSMKSTEALPSLIQKGKASFYAKKFAGRKTFYGERVRPDALEGAHLHLPQNTLVEVTNLDNNRSVIVRINDRGPFTKGRVIDLTHAAAHALGMISKGVANVSLRVVGKGRALALAPLTNTVANPVAYQPLLETGIVKRIGFPPYQHPPDASLCNSCRSVGRMFLLYSLAKVRKFGKVYRMKQPLNLGQVRSYGNVEFLARQLVEGFITGLHKSPFHGFSVEFAEHRLYNTGETTRHIDWKVFGKTEKLFVKRYEEETNLRCHLLIDTSSSMYYPEANYGKMTFSVMAAACLAYMLQRQKDAVSLTTFADTIEIQTPVKSTPSHVHKLFTQLDQLMLQPKPLRKTSAADVIHQVAEKINKRSLVVIFSDMFENSDKSDALFSALQHLRHNLHEVLIFHVTDKKTEEEFAFDERPYEFIDLETGEKVKLQPGQVRGTYQQAVKTYFQELKMRCGQYKIDFIEADIAQGFDQILTSYLVKRTKMK